MGRVKASRKPYHSPRRSEQLDATRRRILGVARQLFSERGYAGTTMEAIAAASGLAVPTAFSGELIFADGVSAELIARAAIPDTDQKEVGGTGNQRVEIRLVPILEP